MSHNKKCFKHLFPFQGLNPIGSLPIRRGQTFVSLENDYAPFNRIRFMYAYFDVYKANPAGVQAITVTVPKSFWSQYRSSAPTVVINAATYNVLYLGNDGVYNYYAVPKGSTMTVSAGFTDYSLVYRDLYGCLTPWGEYQGSTFTSAIPGLAFRGEVLVPSTGFVVVEYFNPTDPYSFHRSWVTQSGVMNACPTNLMCYMRSIIISEETSSIPFDQDPSQVINWPVFRGELVSIPGEAASPNQVTTIIAS